jgi:hypothetical protein
VRRFLERRNRHLVSPRCKQRLNSGCVDKRAGGGERDVCAVRHDAIVRCVVNYSA